MRITTKELRQSFEKIISYIEEQGTKEVDIAENFYWYIPEEVVYSVEKEPEQKELVIGSLWDDIECMQNIVSEETDPIPYSLVWLAAILRAIGESA